MADSSLIDSHAHIYLNQFADDIEEVVQRAKDGGVTAVCMPNIDGSTTKAMIDLAERFPGFCYPMQGLHPCSVTDQVESQLEDVARRLEHDQAIAVGETGTDRYWDVSLFDKQVTAFERQISLALDHDLPVVIHSRESLDHNIGIISKFQNGRLRGVFHCFTGNLEQARQIMDLGFFLGVGGVLTFKNSELKDIMPVIGLECVVLETDAPYLSPVPFRGKRNEPAYMRHTARFLAGVLGVPEETVSEITSRNAELLFRLKAS